MLLITQQAHADTLAASADSYIDSASHRSNFGTPNVLRVQATNKPKLAIVKFPAGASGPATVTINVTFPQGMPPASSVLRINDTTNAWTDTGSRGRTRHHS